MFHLFTKIINTHVSITAMGLPRLWTGRGHLHLPWLPSSRLRTPLLRQERVVRPFVQEHDGR